MQPSSPPQTGQVIGQSSQAPPQEETKVDEYRKEDHIEFGCFSEKKPQSTVDEGRLQRDLAGSYYWSGNWCRDYNFFIANWHPLLGMFFCHPMHPWSKLDRLSMLIFSLGMSCLPSALLAITAHHSSEEKNVQRIAGVLVFVVVTLPIMLIEMALYWIAIGEIQCKGRKNCLVDGDKIAAGAHMFKQWCFSVSLACALSVTGFACIIVVLSGAEMKLMWYPVATARVQSCGLVSNLDFSAMSRVLSRLAHGEKESRASCA